MSSNNKHGFTIIETMLFLGVTGLLALGILAGSNVAINQQRYRDSVNSLRSELQQQYSNVSNVTNNHDPEWGCNSLGKLEIQTAGTESPRGTSECVVMGRYIKSYGDSVADYGAKLQIYSVIGRSKGGVAATTDTSSINGYWLELSEIDNQSKPLEWDATIRIPGADDERLFSMLILRSPLTGAVRTYIANPGSTIENSSLSSIVTDANLRRSLRMCVDAPGGVVTGGVMAVQVSPNASNQSAVETLAEGNGC